MSESVSQVHEMDTRLSLVFEGTKEPRQVTTICCSCGFNQEMGKKKPESIMWRHFRDVLRKTRVGITPPTLTIPADPFGDI